MARVISGGKQTITDDGRIVLTDGGEEIPEDEPVFLLRARDPLATEAIQWLARHYALHRASAHHQETIHLAAAEFLRFRRQHPGRMQLAQQPLPRTGPIPRVTEDANWGKAVSDAMDEAAGSRAQAR